MSLPAVPPTYKAFVYESYGKIDDVLKLQEVKTEPLAANCVRVRVHSVALNPIDYKVVEFLGQLFTGGSPSAEKPYRIGFDFAGVVSEVGSDVLKNGKFQVGDEVFGMAPSNGVGSLGEYFTVDASLVVPKPPQLSFDEAAAIPLVSLTSYQALVDHAKIKSGDRVLILGGSTSVGIFAIQYAKAIGSFVATTASTTKVNLVKSLGADQVIDYTQETWSDLLAPHSFDVVYDCAVEPTSWDSAAQVVLKKETGRFVTLMGRGPAPAESKFGATRHKVFARASGEQLTTIAEHVNRGQIRPVLDSTFDSNHLMEAFARVKSGRAVGKVVVNLRDLIHG